MQINDLPPEILVGFIKFVKYLLNLRYVFLDFLIFGRELELNVYANIGKILLKAGHGKIVI